jgi:hypothetical protein
MAWATSFRSPVASLVYLAVAIANVADNAASSPWTNIYIGLHTGDPSAGNQTTSETNYTSYARVAVARSASGWTDSSGVVTNDAAITFPAATGGSSTVTYVSTGGASSGTGTIVLAGALSASLAVSSGITPQFAISALSITVA